MRTTEPVPSRALLKDQRRWAAFQERLAKARTPGDRYGAAVDHARAVMAGLGTERAEKLAKKLVKLTIKEAQAAVAERDR
jgi:chorismate synthase